MGSVNKMSWMIGGPQGSGVDSSARLFALACAHGGLNVFGKREYYSNIKGEHSYFQIRVSDGVIRSSLRATELLGTFEPETLVRHLFAGSVVKGGAAIFDPNDLKASIAKLTTLEVNLMANMLNDLESKGLEPNVGSVVKQAGDTGVKLFELPYQKILEEIGEEMGVKEFAKLQIIKNTICVGASFGALDYDLDCVLETIDQIFGKKSEKIKKMNRLAIEKGYNHIKNTYGTLETTLKQGPPHDPPQMFMQGTVASALGKIAAGCRFQTYYPITPATDESEFLESHPDGRVVVIQAEDEIAALGMATGAALTGVRSSTSTSGPGFCLMTEVQGWAGINEVPVVIVNYQRGGPSTGLPTRHEQGDLKFAVNSGHGDFPRIVVAPGDLEESFWLMIDAFNWAEEYQLPVVYLSDKNLANNSTLVKKFDLAAARIQRGALLSDADVKKSAGSNGTVGSFERFKVTKDGISPRSVLGQQGGLHWTTGDEHTPVGHISEDPVNRLDMMDKRMRKLDKALAEIPKEKMISVYGPDDAAATIVSWGSNKGAILDAMDELAAEGTKVNYLHIKLCQPFPTKEVTEVLGRAKVTINVEQNFSSQMGGIIRQHTGIAMDHDLIKYTGRPMTQDEISDAVRKILKATDGKRVREVLTHGV